MTSFDSLSGEKRGLFHFENLTHLLSYRSLDELLTEALSWLINTFRATGGSILYASTLVKSVRLGDLSAAAEQKIDLLESVYRERMHRGMRYIQLPSSPPVTKHDIDADQGTLFSIPLINHDRTIGTIGLFMETACDLSHQQLQDMSWFAGGISLVASNVEQLNVTRQRLSQLGLFYQMGQAMTSTFDTNRLFQDTIELALAVIDAQEATLLLLDEERQELGHEVSRGGTVFPQAQYIAPGQGIAGWVAKHGEPVLINNVAEDERFDPRIDGLREQTTKGLLCVPLQIKGKVIGVLEIFNKVPPFEFDEEDLSVLITLAAQVAIALDNARLYHSLRAERDRILEVQESTRRELARNLHDGPVQLLAAIAMQLDYLGRVIRERPEAMGTELEALRKLVRQATQDARLLLFELRPVILETQGLIPALRSYVERLELNERFALHFDPGNFRGRLSSTVAGAIFSIVQEAVNNIGKHAEASNVWIRMQEENGDLIVSVEDDGKGFNVDSVVASYDEGTSLGLLNMKERAELIDGVLTMDSGPKRSKPGTLVQLRMALSRQEEPEYG
jgi:signal transduction histidine kinase